MKKNPVELFQSVMRELAEHQQEVVENIASIHGTKLAAVSNAIVNQGDLIIGMFCTLRSYGCPYEVVMEIMKRSDEAMRNLLVASLENSELDEQAKIAVYRIINNLSNTNASIIARGWKEAFGQEGE